ncbi:MAG: DUF72 domain-containing protein [Streptosporangiales bacterium]|nr:DUF72 domain-containing protein [Streptosporangiales bacterium]
MPVMVGTSGWQYSAWRGLLYPPRVPQRRWLETYAESFATVELNNAFYRLPSYDNFAAWRDRTPEGFVVAVKASRYLTHIKRLNDPDEPVQRLMDAAVGLGERLGPVLLQLPPNLTAAPERLAACLARFPRGTRVAVEPRHASWWNDEVRQVLTEHRAALCWADRLGHAETPLWRTADWGYLRLHEGAAQPWPRYERQTLRSWVDRLADTWPADADVYVYLNNDPGGAAVRDAAHFAALAHGRDLAVTRTPTPDDLEEATA